MSNRSKTRQRIDAVQRSCRSSRHLSPIGAAWQTISATVPLLPTRPETHKGRHRGLTQNGQAQGSRAQEYFDISSLTDAADGRFGQIPNGRR